MSTTTRSGAAGPSLAAEANCAIAGVRVGEELVRARDALERKTQELAHSLAVMRATLESTADGILVTDADGAVIIFNQKFLDIWGLSREAVESARHADLVALVSHLFRDPRQLSSRIREIYESSEGELFDTLELADGRVFERQSRIHVVDAHRLGRVWSYRDITARRHAEDALRNALEAERSARADIARVSRVKDEFLATLSHELRTPLTAILGWARVLTSRKADAQTLARGVEAISRNASAQARLIEDLLDMSRIVSGKVRLDMQPTDIAGVIESAVDAVRLSADAKGIRIGKLLDPEAGLAFVDASRLQQIVWNLLSNAVKFTPHGGRVEVMLHRADGWLEIAVSDSGIGIAADFLPQVFDRFRQADSSTTRTEGGLGLGLAIVKQLVELHGGKACAHSAGPGLGATFSVRLPLSDALADADVVDPQRPAGVPYAPLNLEGISVLVVDDEADARELIQQLLAESRARVVTAATVAQALATLRSLRPDVLLSDIGMPHRDGYDLIREVRALPAEQGGRTPAIALTAFARSEDRTRAMLAGYQVHIAKPIEPHELLATVASLAGRTGDSR
ncbi:MAG TPA: ATP-binding protein [Albitalea sp.]|nr:ATP-binding protein [Albitalea sp.]